jgi:branched-chain amino acid transport system permease protein
VAVTVSERTAAATPVARVVRLDRISIAALVGAAALFVALAALPFVFAGPVQNALTTVFLLVTMASMWNLLAGYAGLVSIGQQAYIGLGAYSVLAFTNIFGVNPFLAVFLAAIVAAVLSLVTSAFVFRLRGGYFAIGTWVVAEVYRLFVANTQRLGGGSGATIAVAGIDRDLRTFATYWIAFSVGVGSVVLVFLLLRSRLGLALLAVRDREDAARTLGISVLRTKVVVYVIASTVCGLTGAVIYLSLLRVQPSATFSVNWTVFMIFAVVIGGIGTVTGPIIGTLVFFLLQQYLGDLGSVYLIILGVVSIAVMLWAPEGLWGLVVKRWNVELFPVQIRMHGDLASRPTEGEDGAMPREDDLDRTRTKR